MTAVVKSIASQAPTLDAWSDDRAWKLRLESDRARAARNQSPEQQLITEEVLNRSLASGADAVALTGSTARGSRTEISDLDFHVVGRRPRYDDLPGDVDVYVTDLRHFWEKLRAGDDIVQWTLRFGCVLDDHAGVFRKGLAAIEREELWPDHGLHLARVSAIADLTGRLIEMGDDDAALDQLRSGLTALARASILAAGAFPLSRSELPAQLEEIGKLELAAALNRTIHDRPGLGELQASLSLLRAPPRLTTAHVNVP